RNRNSASAPGRTPLRARSPGRACSRILTSSSVQGSCRAAFRHARSERGDNLEADPGRRWFLNYFRWMLGPARWKSIAVVLRVLLLFQFAFFFFSLFKFRDLFFCHGVLVALG